MSGPEGPTGPSRGPSVLDIGGEIGAAVVVAPAVLDGEELEIRLSGAEWDGTHTAVRGRGRGCYAALFPAVPAGRYEIRLRASGTAPVVCVDVVGGEVTTAEWSPAG